LRGAAREALLAGRWVAAAEGRRTRCVASARRRSVDLARCAAGFAAAKAAFAGGAGTVSAGMAGAGVEGAGTTGAEVRCAEVTGVEVTGAGVMVAGDAEGLATGVAGTGAGGGAGGSANGAVGRPRGVRLQASAIETAAASARTVAIQPTGRRRRAGGSGGGGRRAISIHSGGDGATFQVSSALK